MKKVKSASILVCLLLVGVMLLGLVACQDPTPPPENKYTATFQTNGGSAVEAQTDVTSVATEPVTTKEGFDFGGWYTDEALTQKATFPYTLTADTTFYAKWTESSGGPEDPEEPAKKYNNAAQALLGGIGGLEKLATAMTGEINTNKFGYAFDAALKINDGDAYKIDVQALAGLLAGAKNEGALTVSKNDQEVFKLQLGGDGNLYLTVGEMKKSFAFSELFKTLIPTELINPEGISGIFGTIGTVFNLIGPTITDPNFVYDENTNTVEVKIYSAKIGEAITNLQPMVEALLGKPLQQLIDELIYSTLPYEIDVVKLLSDLKLSADLTFDMDESDMLTGLGVVLNLEGSSLTLKQYASAPVYTKNEDGTVTRDVTYVEGGDLVIDIPAFKADLSVSLTPITEIAQPEGEFDEVGLLNVDMNGEVTMQSVTEVYGQSAVTDLMTYDLLLKANLDPFALFDETGAFNQANLSKLGYFQLELSYDGTKHPEQADYVNQSSWSGAGDGIWFEIVYDPANSNDTIVYIYARLYGTIMPLRVAVDLSQIDFTAILGSTQKEAQAKLATAAGQEATADAIFNEILGLLKSALGGTEITGGLTVGDLLDDMSYDYNEGFSFRVDKLIGLMDGFMEGLALSEWLFGTGNNQINVRVAETNLLGAPVDYVAFDDDVKALPLPKSATIEGKTLDYNGKLGNTFTAQVTLTNGTTTTGKFNVVKSEGFNPTPEQAGEQEVTLYGYITINALEDQISNALKATLPLGYMKTTVTVYVYDKYTEDAILQTKNPNILTFVNEPIGNLGNTKLPYVQYQKKDGSKTFLYMGNYIGEKELTFSDPTAFDTATNSFNRAGEFVATLELGNGLKFSANVYVMENDLPAALPDTMADSFAVGSSIKEIVESYSYSYLDTTTKEMVTANFTLADVVLIKAANLDANGVIQEGIPVGVPAKLKFSVTYKELTRTIEVTTPVIKGLAGSFNVSNMKVTSPVSNAEYAGKALPITGTFVYYNADRVAVTGEVFYDETTHKYVVKDTNGNVISKGDLTLQIMFGTTNAKDVTNKFFDENGLIRTDALSQIAPGKTSAVLRVNLSFTTTDDYTLNLLTSKILSFRA